MTLLHGVTRLINIFDIPLTWLVYLLIESWWKLDTKYTPYFFIYFEKRIEINSFLVLSRYGALSFYFTVCVRFSTGIPAFLHSRFTSANMFFKRQQIYVEWSERDTYTHMYYSSCFLSLLSVHASLV